MITERRISILLGGSLTASPLNVRLTSLDVVAETAKGVQVSNGRQLIWLPKKALLRRNRDSYYRLARWFQPDSYQTQALNATARVTEMGDQA